MARKPITRLRWWIGGLLFASTVINYIDRQTLNVLAPFLKAEYHWTNTDFATIVIAFRVAYSLMQFVGGRLIDLVGTRQGLTITVAWYSAMAMLTSLASGLWSFRIFRFLLGMGEAANWPGATKAVAEWFPARERGWAVALFDSGSAIGGAIAPALVYWLYRMFGTWRPAFFFTGCFGFIWLIAWRRLYFRPEEHPRISHTERALILADQNLAEDSVGSAPSWTSLLRFRQIWGVIVVRSLLDPYWFLIADWFALFLVSKGFKLEDTLVGFWVPFLSADFGNFFGGGVSSYFIQRGWPVAAARKIVFAICGPMMLTLIPAVWTTNLAFLIVEFAIATFGYAACATIHLTLPSDLFHSRSVATVSGISGMVTGAVTILSTFAVGTVTDRYSFAPILLGASVAPVLATVSVFLLVKNTPQSGNGILRKI